MQISKHVFSGVPSSLKIVWESSTAVANQIMTEEWREWLHSSIQNNCTLMAKQPIFVLNIKVWQWVFRQVVASNYFSLFES